MWTWRLENVNAPEADTTQLALVIHGSPVSPLSSLTKQQKSLIKYVALIKLESE